MTPNTTNPKQTPVEKPKPVSPRYRALLLDPEAKQERPIQTYAENWQEIEAWAGLVLKGASAKAVVQPYETIEVALPFFVQEPPKK